MSVSLVILFLPPPILAVEGAFTTVSLDIASISGPVIILHGPGFVVLAVLVHALGHVLLVTGRHAAVLASLLDDLVVRQEVVAAALVEVAVAHLLDGPGDAAVEPNTGLATLLVNVVEEQLLHLVVLGLGHFRRLIHHVPFDKFCEIERN